MRECIPAVLIPQLNEYARQLERQGTGLVSACYIHGSIALDCFDPRHSDVDFIGILSRPASAAEIESLRAIHRGIERAYPQWKMDGAYLLPEGLGRADNAVGPVLRYNLGRLESGDRLPLSGITWMILKQNGIPLFGPLIEALNLDVDMAALLRGQLENLNTYWARWAGHPKRALMLLSDWGVEWTVLGVLRLYYTLRERQVTSKVGAGEYGLRCLPERWHSIVREALALRTTGTRQRISLRSRITRAAEARRFAAWVIEESNRINIA